MLDPRQDRALQGLARSIAGSVDALGGSCTARLLAHIALGLVDHPGIDEPPASTSSASTASEPASSGSAGNITHPHAGRNNPIVNHPPHRRTRP